MAASVNNIAATFATVPNTSSSSSSSSSSNLNHQKSFPLSVSVKSISTSWNPHTTLRRSFRSSFLNIYGPPGPPPHQSISGDQPRPHITKHYAPFSILTGGKIPNITLSYLRRGDTVQTISLSSLCKGKKVVFMVVTAAFSPKCTRFVRKVESERGKGSDLMACVSANDPFVMRAWREHLGPCDKTMMLSDGGGEFSKALGMAPDADGGGCLGLDRRSRRFYLCAKDGIITSAYFDEDDNSICF